MVTEFSTVFVIFSAGFDYEKARIDLEIPDNFDVMAMIAIAKKRSDYNALHGSCHFCNTFWNRLPSLSQLWHSKNFWDIIPRKTAEIDVLSWKMMSLFPISCKRMMVKSIEQNQKKMTNIRDLISNREERQQKIQLWWFGQTYMKVNTPIGET